MRAAGSGGWFAGAVEVGEADDVAEEGACFDDGAALVHDGSHTVGAQLLKVHDLAGVGVRFD